MSTWIVVIITVIIWALVWGGWDLYIVARYGLNSGKTISWSIFQGSQTHPAIPFLIGLSLGLLCGHLFLGMSGITTGLHQ